jgi:hypothetical protein
LALALAVASHAPAGAAEEEEEDDDDDDCDDDDEDDEEDDEEEVEKPGEMEHARLTPQARSRAGLASRVLALSPAVSSQPQKSSGLK